MAIDADRLEREREFHDVRFHNDEARAAVGKFYQVVPGAQTDYETSLRRWAQGRVLEYGCGTGSYAFDLATAAAVVGIDISPVAIEKANEIARARGVDPTFLEMNAEELSFAPASFDLVCGSGILHHLDIERAAAQISKVVKPGGAAVFMEPMGYNPLINWYRNRTPEMRTEDEHPLLNHDLAVLRDHAESIEVRYHGLAALAAAPIVHRRAGSSLLSGLEMADRGLLKIPGVRSLAWIALIELRY